MSAEITVVKSRPTRSTNCESRWSVDAMLAMPFTRDSSERQPAYSYYHCLVCWMSGRCRLPSRKTTTKLYQGRIVCEEMCLFPLPRPNNNGIYVRPTMRPGLGSQLLCSPRKNVASRRGVAFSDSNRFIDARKEVANGSGKKRYP
jgi:hypothetical protein